MTLDDKLQKIWDAVEDTRKTTQRIEVNMAAHCSQKDIHTAPPCESVQTLSNRVWAAVSAAILALAGAVYSLVMDRLPH